ncbi:MAG: hypothetical protein Q8L26_06640 [Candidatus Omnitrophota bacterium]|nr:hypothetical protein [Candidatus Omnitrophota bacterium]
MFERHPEMKEKNTLPTKIYPFLTFLLVILTITAGKSFAAFSISVTPFEGGQDIRFGNISAKNQPPLNKEVTVRATTDIAKQYRVIQQILEPLADETGAEIPYGDLLVYAIRGTNTYGTLSVINEIPISPNRTVIYTSNPQGAQDSFQLAYRLIPENIAAGSYRGRISYTLEPIESGVSSSTLILNIFVEISQEGAIKIQTQDSSKNVFLKQADAQKHSFEVSFQIIGGLGRQFKIAQVISEALMSNEGIELPLEVVSFAVSENKKGVAVLEPTVLTKKEQLIYSSSPDGASDNFVVSYVLSDISSEKPGKYATKIKYILEGTGNIESGLLETLHLQVENDKIFDLEITSETGWGIAFTDLKAETPPRINEVTIEVKTNLAKPYQITQNVLSDLTDKQGNTIPNDYFHLRTESINTKGNLRFSDKGVVKKGDAILFSSDNQGSPDKFKIIYELECPKDLKAGDYSTRITYSLLEI